MLFNPSSNSNVNSKTIIVDFNGNHEHDIVGELNTQWFLTNGYYVDDPEEGIIAPYSIQKIYIGNTVTGIGNNTFSPISSEILEYHFENFATMSEVLQSNWGMDAGDGVKAFCSDGILAYDGMSGWYEWQDDEN